MTIHTISMTRLLPGKSSPEASRINYWSTEHQLSASPKRSPLDAAVVTSGRVRCKIDAYGPADLTVPRRHGARRK